MRILLTGMTAPQASSSANARSRSYAAFLHAALHRAGHIVTWRDPSMSDTPALLDKLYDVVLVGIAPVTSLAANRTYPTLNLLSQRWGRGPLLFFVDAPMPVQITQALNSIKSNPDSLVKPFYSNRKEYEWFVDNRAPLLDAIERLASQTWPTTLYPSLPWEETSPERYLPSAAAGRLVGLNLDGLALRRDHDCEEVRDPFWAADGASSSWTKQIEKGLHYPVRPMRQNKGSTDVDVLLRLSTTTGALITPQKNGETWWTYRYVQALNACAPIATEWRESSQLHSSWSVLAAQIEQMTQDERNILSQEQFVSYALHSGSEIEAISRLDELVKGSI